MISQKQALTTSAHTLFIYSRCIKNLVLCRIARIYYNTTFLYKMKPPRQIRIVSFLIASTIGITLTLFIVERYLSLLQYKKYAIVFNQDRFIRIRNLSPNSRLLFKPSYTINKKDSFDLDIKDYSATTDSFGFIVTNRNHLKPDLKLAFFGSSTAQCLFVDEEKRLPEAVARSVEEKMGLKVSAWNCAAGGTHSYHTLNMFNNLAVYLNVDYAFLLGNPNDVSALIHYKTFNNSNIDKGIFFTIEGYQKKNSVSEDGILPYTVDAFKTRFGLKPEVDDFGDARGLPLILDSAVIMPNVARVFRTIVSSCRANNVKPVIITQFNNFDRLNYSWLLSNMPYFTPTAEEYEKVKLLFHQYNGTLRQIASEEKVMLIDLDSISLGFDCFYDAIHFNTKGSAAVSEIIATQFVENLRKEGQLR